MNRAASHAMHTYPIRRIVEHHDGLKSFYFPRTFDAAPGQFVMLWLPGVDEKPFSISDITEHDIEVTIKALGPFSRALMDCKAGARLGLRGPFGSYFTPQGRALLVGGGIGIAPMRFLANHFAQNGTPFRAIMGAQNHRDLVFAEDFARLGAQFTTDDGSFGTPGLVTQAVEALCEKETFDTLYACGPEGLLVALKHLAERFGLNAQFSMERHMKCGIGICGSCCVDGSGICICREGPVLDFAALNQITDLGQPHRDASGARKPICQ